MTCRIGFGFCGTAVLLAALSAQAAQCDNPVTSEDIAQCLGTELRDSDARINRSYKELMSKLDSSGQARLRNEQRAWIRDRDAACGLDTRETNREKWYQSLSTDYLKTVCVTRYTRQRTAELDRMLARLAPQAQPKAASAEDAGRSAMSPAPADYRALSSESREKGRWYVEMTVNSAHIAGFSPTALFLGCIEEKAGANFGTLLHIRGSDTSAPVVRVGFALDLEAGKLYVRRNGAWNRGAPGSSGGIDLKLGRAYRCGADSTALIGPLVEKGFLQINFGGRAFAYSMPDGYQPFSELAVLRPHKAEPAAPRYQGVRPAPDDERHFVARTRHLLELVQKHPAPKNEPWFKINGVQFWPASPISGEALKMLEDERGVFSSSERDQALRCGVPAELPADTQVLLLEARGSRLAVPVFLTREGKELHYLELSLDQPGAPVLLVITGYDGLAVRITTSPATRLAAVHLHTYYPNIVLGVEPGKVTQQYYGRGRNQDCRYGFSDGVQSSTVVQRLHYDPGKAIRYKADGQDRVAIGTPQPAKRAPPMLGTFLDPEMPVPSNYGIVVLADLGYIRPTRLKTEDGGRGGEAFEVLKPFRIPAGLAGSHSVTFVLTRDSPVPSGELAHSSMVRQLQ